ncbi:hypothetical protein A3Q56_04610 [Intoshia linei]|uniref:Uncharacterized protein n=1 Tax=Intoshia linei TaxID=1819745 RepID=A0A177B043_9BILA|nr:hypothetical protein A3Q56_04610 [Intoshia linei]
MPNAIRFHHLFITKLKTIVLKKETFYFQYLYLVLFSNSMHLPNL